VGVLGGCSQLYDLSPDQCGASADCIGMFGAGFVCDDGLCVAGGAPGTKPTTNRDPKPPLPASSTTPLDECGTHVDCIERLGDVDPHACVAGECVPLRSEDCPLLLPAVHDAWLENLTTSDAVLLGAYSPVPRTTLVSDITRFYDLAVSELTTVVQGFPNANGGRRQVVMVVCDGETPSREALRRSANHLMRELRVPGLVSSLQSADLQYLFEEVGADQGVFVMSALDADSTIAEIVDDGLIWTMLTGAKQVAAAVAPLIERVVNHLERQQRVEPGKLRVALVAPTGEPRLLGEMAAAIRDDLVFNGQAALDNYPETFRLIDIDTVYGDPQAAEDQSGVVAQLLDFAPHVVIAMAANEFLSDVIPLLESRWQSDVSAQARPFYVLSPYHLDNVELPRALESDSTISQRMVGVAYASADDQRVYRDYLLRLEQAYPELVGQTSHLRQENFYDAPYYLLYAAAAAGDVAVLRGEDLARGMSRLMAGPSYEVGRDDMVDVFAFLQSAPENTLTLRGTLGPANFDATTGERADVGSVFCVTAGGQTIADVIRYDAQIGSFEDAVPSISQVCIEGF